MYLWNIILSFTWKLIWEASCLASLLVSLDASVTWCRTLLMSPQDWHCQLWDLKTARSQSLLISKNKLVTWIIQWSLLFTPLCLQIKSSMYNKVVTEHNQKHSCWQQPFWRLAPFAAYWQIGNSNDTYDKKEGKIQQNREWKNQFWL